MTVESSTFSVDVVSDSDYSSALIPAFYSTLGDSAFDSETVSVVSVVSEDFTTTISSSFCWSSEDSATVSS